MVIGTTGALASLLENAPGDGDRCLEGADGCRLDRERTLQRVRSLREAIRARVPAETRIAFLTRDPLVAAAAFLGITDACTFVPLDPSRPTAALAAQLSALRCDALLATVDLDVAAGRIATVAGIPSWRLEGGGRGAFRVSGEAVRPMTPRAATDDRIESRPALLLQTSGSTGRPKGVPQPSTHLRLAAATVADCLSLDVDDRGLNPMPLFHVHGLIAGLLAPLMRGGSVCTSHGVGAADTSAMFERFRPTWITAVPTRHAAHLAVLRERASTSSFPGLRLLRTASAPMPLPLLEALEAFFGAPVIEAYGMTETTHQITSNPTGPGERRPGSVGLPTGFEVRVVDDAGKCLPIGRPGRVVVAGSTLMFGYDRASAGGTGLQTDGSFDTGDLGRLDADGFLYLTGRAAETINRGGEKIQPLGIDRVLHAHPAVAEAVTFARAHPTLGQDVAVAVVLIPGADIDGAGLREHCLDRLAGYQVPSSIVIVDSLPVSPTGKLSRTAVADALERTSSNPPSGVGPVVATDAMTRRIGAWVRDALGLDAEPVPSDNFFMLGGDSLSAARLVTRLAESTGKSLAPDSLFRHPVIEEFAAIVAAARPSQAMDGERRFALLPDGLLDWWLIGEMDPHGTCHHRSFEIVVDRIVPTWELRVALDRLVVAQPVFRLRLDRRAPERRPWRIGAPYPPPLIDLSRPRAVPDLLAPFDVDSGPLIRAGVVRAGGRCTRLVIDAHHLTMDDVSEALVERALHASLSRPPRASIRAVTEDELRQVLSPGSHESPADRRGGTEPVSPARLVDALLEHRPASGFGFEHADGPLPKPVIFDLDGVRVSSLERLASRHCTTVPALLLTLWHRSGGSDGDVPTDVYRVPVSRRTASADRVCGFVVDTCPIVMPGVGRGHDARGGVVSAESLGALLDGTYPTVTRVRRQLLRSDEPALAEHILRAPLFNMSATTRPDRGRAKIPSAGPVSTGDLPPGSLEIERSGRSLVFTAVVVPERTVRFREVLVQAVS